MLQNVSGGKLVGPGDLNYKTMEYTRSGNLWVNINKSLYYMLLKDNWFKLKKQYIVRFVTHASKMYDSSTKMRGKKWKHCHKVLMLRLHCCDSTRRWTAMN